MLVHTTWLISKMDPIKYIFQKPALIGKISRWLVVLLEYDIVHVTQKSVKESVLANYVAHSPLADYQPVRHEFPDKDIMVLLENYQPMRHEFPDKDIMVLLESHKDKEEWIMLFDGASNALGHGIGVVLISPEDRCFPFIVKLGFNCTNNMVEYEACTMGIAMALEY
ncbi:hypothetical protein CR513_17306, partial [Mucuna pruriens]